MQKKPDYGHNQGYGQQKLKLNIMNSCPDCCGAVCNNIYMHVSGQAFPQSGQQTGNAVGDLDYVCARLPLHGKHNRRPEFILAVFAAMGDKGRQFRVFRPIHHIGHIF